jgi:hypothetical protein
MIVRHVRMVARHRLVVIVRSHQCSSVKAILKKLCSRTVSTARLACCHRRPSPLEVEDEPSECTVGKTGAERSDHRFVSEVENGTKMNVVEPPDELHCVGQSSLVSTRLGELLKALPSCR